MDRGASFVSADAMIKVAMVEKTDLCVSEYLCPIRLQSVCPIEIFSCREVDAMLALL